MSKRVQSGEKDPAHREFYRDFLTQYHRRFSDQKIPIGTGTRNWLRMGSAGKPGASYNLSFTQDGRFRVELTWQHKDSLHNKALFDRLKEQKETIEAEVGEPLSWDRLDGIQRSRIAAYYPGLAAVTDPLPDRTKYLSWAVDMMDRFRRAVGPRLAD